MTGGAHGDQDISSPGAGGAGCFEPSTRLSPLLEKSSLTHGPLSSVLVFFLLAARDISTPALQRVHRDHAGFPQKLI